MFFPNLVQTFIQKLMQFFLQFDKNVSPKLTQQFLQIDANVSPKLMQTFKAWLNFNMFVGLQLIESKFSFLFAQDFNDPFKGTLKIYMRTQRRFWVF